MAPSLLIIPGRSVVVSCRANRLLARQRGLLRSRSNEQARQSRLFHASTHAQAEGSQPQKPATLDVQDPWGALTGLDGISPRRAIPTRRTWDVAPPRDNGSETTPSAESQNSRLSAYDLLDSFRSKPKSRTTTFTNLTNRTPQQMEMEPAQPRPPARMKLGASAGRKVHVTGDLAGAISQRYHERPGLKRKRLKSERWRRNFKVAFQAVVGKVKKLRAKGW